jgi:putative transposase
MERKISFVVGEYYHIYNRGVNKSEIFGSDHDRDHFIRLLFASNSTRAVRFSEIKHLPFDVIIKGEPLVSVVAYCLMTNHFHILIKEIQEGGISSFMSKLTTGYSMYFNKLHERVGPLFQSRFKASHADNDAYLQYLFAYIHLNPVKLIEPEWKEKGIKNQALVENYLKNYRYSSYGDYIGEAKNREEEMILNKEGFHEYFDNAKEFKDYLADCLAYYNDKPDPQTLQGTPL